jgi:hypothetical protein
MLRLKNITKITHAHNSMFTLMKTPTTLNQHIMINRLPNFIGTETDESIIEAQLKRKVPHAMVSNVPIKFSTITVSGLGTSITNRNMSGPRINILFILHHFFGSHYPNA